MSNDQKYIRDKYYSRRREIHRVRWSMERDDYPRIQMFLLVGFAGLVGFFTSLLLLRFGLSAMWMRYPLAFVAMYAAFLLLLWLWLRTRIQDYGDAVDILNILPTPDATNTTADASADFGGFGGGMGGGGGASGSFDASESLSLASADSSVSAGDMVEATTEAGEIAIPIILLVVAGALFFFLFFLVYSAPLLFAELLVDGALAVSLYRRLRGVESPHWLHTAIRKTFWPFFATAIVFAGSGWGLSLYAPKAHSIGDVIKQIL